MAPPPHLIYCAAWGRRFARIAVEAGLEYGCRSDQTPREAPVVFVDLNWRQPNLERHLAFCREHRPRLAVVPDLVERAALPATLRYAEQLAQYATQVIIVPKIPGVLEALPHEPWVVLGYSVPTKYGGADSVFLWEWSGWPVHLLGGSPMAQRMAANYCQVVSLDGNATQGAAQRGVYYDARKNQWITRDPAIPQGPDLCYRAFARSCQELVTYWRQRG